MKLLENTFRAVNIGLVNEVLLMCEKLGVNAWEVIDAAAKKPFGFVKFAPGSGLGGHCIPPPLPLLGAQNIKLHGPFYRTRRCDQYEYARTLGLESSG